MKFLVLLGILCVLCLDIVQVMNLGESHVSDPTKSSFSFSFALQNIEKPNLAQMHQKLLITATQFCLVSSH